MKKKFTLAALLALSTSGIFAQNQGGMLVPNEVNPIGLIYNYYNKADASYPYYTSEYVPVAADAGTITIADGNLKYTGKNNNSTFQQAIYLLEKGGPATIDISSNPIVYVKVKGTLGDIFNLSLKNKAFKDPNTDENIPEYYIGGFNARKTITCSDYSWYKFDFSTIHAQLNGTNVPGTNVPASKNKIYSMDIKNDGILTGRTSFDFYIDSILVGNTGITPKLPANIVNTKWSSPFGAFTAPTLDYTYSGTTGNTANKVGTENVFTYSAQTNKASYEINYPTYDGSGKISLDMTKNPFIKATISGKVGDTLRFNLKKSAANSFAFIDGFSYLKVINTTGFVNYVFDFTPVASSLTDIAEVNMQLYPAVAFTGSSFNMSSIVLGGDVEYCSVQPTGILDEVYNTPTKINVYPNPAATGDIMFVEGAKINTAEIVSLSGVSMATISVSNNQFVVPSDIQSGLYVVRLKGQTSTSVSKIQIK